MFKDASKPGKGSGLAGWPLRRKLALALAIPLILAAVLGGLRVQSALAEAADASSSANQVTVLGPAVEYVTAAETAMVAAQSTSSTAKGDLLDALDDIEAAAEALDDARQDAELTTEQATQVQAMLELSQAVRGEQAQGLSADTWIAQLRQLQSSLTQLITAIINEQNEPEPRLEQLAQALGGRLSLSMQQALAADTEGGAAVTQDLFSELGVEAAAIDRLASALGESEEAIAQLRTANGQHTREVREGGTQLGGRDAYLPYDALITELLDGVDQELTSTASDSRRSALLSAVLTLFALVAAVLLALLVSKLLLDPINRVREGALAVARRRLPDAVSRIRSGEEPEPIEPIDVQTNEEIGQLARAVDDLHRQALHLASGEAQLRSTVGEMFVTLSRRSNSLINQQLALIERLEHDEEDPKRLESLFRLDHLASRMRRTADSLLILADAPSAQGAGFALTVGEALQAATAGVQDYHRVQITSHLGTRISDEAGADVVHMLTELVDNALAYSPPAEPVRLDASVDSTGVTITVTDAGIGIPASERDNLNVMLGEGGEATPDTARRMGLFVVSRLANRHDIRVSLTKGVGGGTVATLVLPASVLPELPQPGARPAATPAVPAGRAAEPEVAATEPVASAAPAEAVAEVERTEHGLPKRAGRRGVGTRSKEKPAKEKAAKPSRAAKRGQRRAEAPAPAEPTADATTQTPSAPAAPAAAAASATTPSPGLLPRRQPGAQLPLTSPDALVPITPASTEGGSLFGSRPGSDAPADAPAAQAPTQSPAPAAQAPAEVPAAAEQAPEPEQVATVVPISALAGLRAEAQAQAEAEARARGELPEQPSARHADAPAPTNGATPEAGLPTRSPGAALSADTAGDPLTASYGHAGNGPSSNGHSSNGHASTGSLGAGLPTRSPGEALAADVDADTSAPAEVPAEVLAEPPAASASLDQAPTRHAEHALPPSPESALPRSAESALPRSPESALPRRRADVGPTSPRREEESPIFSSMRSGWLSTDGESEFHTTEVDRGWARAESVAHDQSTAQATEHGLPVRQPGQRLVPGSVEKPTTVAPRDPEAIRARLSAHAAGVSRGRRAVKSPTQHTEAGPS